MAKYVPEQSLQNSMGDLVPQTHNPNQFLAPYVKGAELVNAAGWTVNDTNGGENAAAGAQAIAGSYEPAFPVRAISIFVSAQSTVGNVVMDVDESNRITVSLTTGIFAPIHVTKVWLVAATTATRIILWK